MLSLISLFLSVGALILIYSSNRAAAKFNNQQTERMRELSECIEKLKTEA
jgi:hypothetical protein